jgi:hypothetical protein
MIYIEPPQKLIYKEAPNDIDVQKGSVAVFLAGGITNCPDFQSEICNKLKSLPDSLIILNPRRANFPIHDPSAAETQIRWEYKMLRRANLISFWFPKETLCPIVLLELGAAMMTKTPLVVGVHPDYVRKQDVVIQASCARPGLPVFDNLEDVVDGIKFWYGQLRAF